MNNKNFDFLYLNVSRKIENQPSKSMGGFLLLNMANHFERLFLYNYNIKEIYL